MSFDLSLELMSRMLIAAVLISAPILLLGTVVGVLVSVVQVLTQVQDVSLTFVPKLLAVMLGLMLFGPWMLKTLVHYAQSVISDIPALF